MVSSKCSLEMKEQSMISNKSTKPSRVRLWSGRSSQQTMSMMTSNSVNTSHLNSRKSLTNKNSLAAIFDTEKIKNMFEN